MSHDDWRHVDRDDDDCKLRWHAFLQLQFAYKYPLHKNYLWRITIYHSIRPLILRDSVFSHAFLQTPSIQFNSIQKNDEFSFCFIDFLPQSCQEYSSKVVLLSGFFFFEKIFLCYMYKRYEFYLGSLRRNGPVAASWVCMAASRYRAPKRQNFGTGNRNSRLGLVISS